MKAFVPVIIVLLAAAALAAGCTGSQTAVTPVPTAEETAATTVPTTTQTATFTLGETYLSHPTPYSFTSENDVYNEQFRVTQGQPWGIEFHVNPTNEDPQYTWFTLTVTNLDSGKTETYGYGREYALEKDQIYPMYGYGPYEIEMKGNRVSVKVNVAKRNP